MSIHERIIRPWRFVLAAGLAALVAVGVVYAAGLVYLRLSPTGDAVPLSWDALGGIGVFLLFGWPPAFVIAMVAARLGQAAIERAGRGHEVWPAVALGAVVGAATLWLLSRLEFMVRGADVAVMAAGGCAGAAAAMAFVLASGRRAGHGAARRGRSSALGGAAEPLPVPRGRGG